MTATQQDVMLALLSLDAYIWHRSSSKSLIFMVSAQGFEPWTY